MKFEANEFMSQVQIFANEVVQRFRTMDEGFQKLGRGKPLGFEDFQRRFHELKFTCKIDLHALFMFLDACRVGRVTSRDFLMLSKLADRRELIELREEVGTHVRRMKAFANDRYG